MESSVGSKRLVSLDIFRGLTIAGMLVVNNPGSWSCVYKPLAHAPWHGWTPTDLIFPFFLFIVGLAIPLALDKQIAQKKSGWMVFFRIFRRACLLFFLGLFLNRFPFKIVDVRIPGVLQRIAVCYLFSALLYWGLLKKENDQLLLRAKGIGLIVFSILIGYFLAMKYIPVPGYGPGIWDSKEGNLAAYLDRLWLGNHLWAYAHHQWDPEGILSTFPALATTLTGLLCGWWIKQNHEPMRKLALMLLAGNVLIALAYIWEPFFPFNKALWTSSYVLLTTGMALIVFGLCYWYADIQGRKFGTLPFRILGSNAILVYFCSTYLVVWMNRLHITPDVSVYVWIYQTFFKTFFGDRHLASLSFALAYVLFWLLIAGIFYRAKLFLRL